MHSYHYLPTRGEFKILAVPGPGQPARAVTTVTHEPDAAELADALTSVAAALLNEAPYDPVYAAYRDSLDPTDPDNAEELAPPFAHERGDLAVFGLDHASAQVAFAHIGGNDTLREVCGGLPEPVRRALADEVGLLAATMLTAQEQPGTAVWAMRELQLAAFGPDAAASLALGAPIDPFRAPDLELDRIWDPFREVWTATCRRCWCRFALEPIRPTALDDSPARGRVEAEAWGAGTVFAPRFEHGHGCRDEDCVCHDVPPVLPGTSQVAVRILEAGTAVAKELRDPLFGTDEVVYLATGGVFAGEDRPGLPDDPGISVVVGGFWGGRQLAFGPDPDEPGRWLIAQRELDYDDMASFGVHLVPVTGYFRTAWKNPEPLLEHDPEAWPDGHELVAAVTAWYLRAESEADLAAP